MSNINNGIKNLFIIAIRLFISVIAAATSWYIIKHIMVNPVVDYFNSPKQEELEELVSKLAKEITDIKQDNKVNNEILRKVTECLIKNQEAISEISKILSTKSDSSEYSKGKWISNIVTSAVISYIVSNVVQRTLGYSFNTIYKWSCSKNQDNKNSLDNQQTVDLTSQPTNINRSIEEKKEGGGFIFSNSDTSTPIIND